MAIYKKIRDFAVAAICSLAFFFPAFSAQVSTSVSGKDVARLGLSFAQLGLGMLVDSVDGSNLDVSTVKNVAIGNVGIGALDFVSKACDYSNGARDSVSLGAHAHAFLWKIIKGSKDYVMLDGLKRDYSYACSKGGFNTHNAPDSDRQARRSGKLLFRLAKFGLSCWRTLESSDEKNKSWAVVGEGVCDLALRYLCCKDKKNGFSSWIDTAEKVSVGAACVYDVGKAACVLVKDDASERDHEKLYKAEWDSQCPGCNEKYSESGGVVCYMDGCKHHCCADCVEKSQKEKVVKEEEGYFVGGYKLSEDEAAQMPPQERAAAWKKVPTETKVFVTCPCCRKDDQAFSMAALDDPVTYDAGDGVEKVECSICLEPITGEKKKLSCGHEFCFDCISGWFAAKKYTTEGATCPLCRAPFKM